MLQLAAKYGLSDVGLAKICKKHDIPKPTRGYWSQVKAGRKPTQTPLPSQQSETKITLHTHSITASQQWGLKKGGIEFPMEIRVNISEFKGLKTRIAAIRDLTEQRKLEKELLQAQKMESIGTLAGGIAHDFNNILSAIIGYTELARDGSPEGSSVANDLDKVLEASGKAANLVKQILAFSRQGEAEYVLIQPASIVKKSIEMLRSTLPTTIEIS